MGYFVKQSQTAQPLLFLMVDSADHISPKTGLTPTVTLSKNGGSFASPAGAVTEVGSGWYKVAGNATDTGTLGPLILHATASGADPTDDRYDVVAYDPQDAAALGLSRLDAAITSRLASGSYTAPDNATIAAIAGYVDTEVAAIKAKTDNLPSAFPTNFSSLAITAGGAVTAGTVGSGAITSSSFGAGAIDASAIATDAIGSAELASSAVTEIQSGLATQTSVTSIANAIGAFTGSGVNTVLGFLKALLSKTASTPSDIGGTFDPSTDSVEALRDRGDAAWVTGGGGGGGGTDWTAGELEQIRSALGIDGTKTAATGGQLQAIAGYVDTEVAAILAAVDTEVAAIKAKTDNLPASPAAVGSQMNLNPAQTLSNTQTSGTVGEALLAARAGSFGKWVITDTTWDIYAPDGTTLIHSFTLDSATSPTSRT